MTPQQHNIFEFHELKLENINLMFFKLQSKVRISLTSQHLFFNACFKIAHAYINIIRRINDRKISIHHFIATTLFHMLKE